MDTSDASGAPVQAQNAPGLVSLRDGMETVVESLNFANERLLDVKGFDHPIRSDAYGLEDLVATATTLANTLVEEANSLNDRIGRL